MKTLFRALFLLLFLLPKVWGAGLINVPLSGVGSGTSNPNAITNNDTRSITFSNIVSVNTQYVTTLIVTNLYGNGGNLTNLNGGSVTGTVANATTSGYVTSSPLSNSVVTAGTLSASGGTTNSFGNTGFTNGAVVTVGGSLTVGGSMLGNGATLTNLNTTNLSGSYPGSSIYNSQGVTGSGPHIFAGTTGGYVPAATSWYESPYGGQTNNTSYVAGQTSIILPVAMTLKNLYICQATGSASYYITNAILTNGTACNLLCTLESSSAGATANNSTSTVPCVAGTVISVRCSIPSGGTPTSITWGFIGY